MTHEMDMQTNLLRVFFGETIPQVWGGWFDEKTTLGGLQKGVW